MAYIGGHGKINSKHILKFGVRPIEKKTSHYLELKIIPSAILKATGVWILKISI